MIPDRFVTEYPERCLELLDAFEPTARAKNLTGTFSIMLAASILTVPWERLQARHPMHDGDDELAGELRRLSQQHWQAAQFWNEVDPGDWRFSRVMGDPNKVYAWRDENDENSMSEGANTIDRRRVGEVFRVLRNALAHGNILYLNAQGHEVPGTQVEFLGFLSRYEESPEQREASETYRLVAVREADFLSFIRAWATWVSRHGQDDSLRSAA